MVRSASPVAHYIRAILIAKKIELRRQMDRKVQGFLELTIPLLLPPSVDERNSLVEDPLSQESGRGTPKFQVPG